MKRCLALILISILFINIFLVGNVIAQSKIRNFAERIKTSPGEDGSNEKENVGKIKEGEGIDVQKVGPRNIERRIDRIENKDEVIRIRKEFRERIKEGDGEIEVGGRIKIRVRELDEEGERKEIIAGKINAKTGLNLTVEDIGNGTTLRAILSNGRLADVKIMPDRASVIALARLKAKCIERNCSIELREVGKGDKIKIAYELETEKESRILFIFKAKIRIKAEIDAETGEIILVKRPWWAFLAKEKDEGEDEIDKIENEENETEEEAEKVTLCHIPPGNEGGAHTISVGKPAVRAHLAHGDYLGECKVVISNRTIPTNESMNETVGNQTLNEINCLLEGEKGDYGVAPQSLKKCCEELIDISDFYLDVSNECKTIGEEAFVCTMCGDGVCGVGENECNCRKDCPSEKPNCTEYNNGAVFAFIKEDGSCSSVGADDVTNKVAPMFGARCCIFLPIGEG